MLISFPASRPETDRSAADVRDRLREQIDALLTAREGDERAAQRPGISSAFGDARDAALHAGTHEWFPSRGTAIAPPLAVLIGLAWRALERGGEPHPGRVLWIGRACRPYPRALIRWSSPDAARGGPDAGIGDRRLLERSVFVRTGEGTAALRERVWAIEQAARCAGVACVIADGRGIGMADSRRLQLAASDGQRDAHREDPGRPVWLVRPPSERGVISAARTRWIVEPRAPDPVGAGNTQGDAPLEEAGEGAAEWTVELVRCKGVRDPLEGARRWAVRREHDTGSVQWRPAADVGLAPHAVDGPGRAARTA